MFDVRLGKDRFMVSMILPWAICKKLGVRVGDHVTISECSEFPDNDMVCIQKMAVKNGKRAGK